MNRKSVGEKNLRKPKWDVARFLSGKRGVLRAVPSKDRKSWAASFPLREEVLFRGEGDPSEYDFDAEYVSMKEPYHPFEREALRWGVGEVVRRVTGKGLPSFWEAPGLLFATYLGKDFAVFYWKNGPVDLFELWSASSDRGLLTPELETESFAKTFRALEKSKEEVLDALAFVTLEAEELFPFFFPK